MKKFTSIMLAVLLMLTCSGCVMTKLPEEPEENPPGRYVESTLGNPGGWPYASGEIDGELYAITSTGLYQSMYSGAAWGTAWNDSPTLVNARNEWTITAGCFTPDGTIIICESIWGEPDENGSAFAAGFNLKEISPDGAERTIDITLPDDIDPNATMGPSMTTPSKMLVAPDGSLLIRTENHSLHRFDRETGELLLTYSSSFIHGFESFAIVGDTLVTIAGLEGSALYDYKTGEPLENDKVLNEFVTGFDEEGKPIQRQNEYGMNIMGSGGNLFTYPEDQDEYLYICSTNGVYRHKLMGNIIQQLVSGELCSLFNPACSVTNMFKASDERFIATCSSTNNGGPGVLQYIYDPDIPFFPDKILKVYTLQEDQALQEQIAVYQKEHPEVYLIYQVGLNFGAGMEAEDALRNLSVDIKNGEGPDIILLSDYMPIESYIEKGLLMDLTELKDELVQEEDLFENLIDPYGRDDGIFALNSFFGFPLIFAQKDVLEKATDLDGLVSEIVRLRFENTAPQQDCITGLQLPYSMLELFLSTSAPALMKADGSVDREKLTHFMEQTKTAWDAEQRGRGYEPGSFYTNNYHSFIGYGVKMGNSLMTPAYVSGVGEFACMLTVKSELPDYDYKPITGMSENTYSPSRMVGILESSEQKEIARDFVKQLFSVSAQCSDYVWNGIPVNRKALEEMLKQMGNRGTGPVTVTTPEGERVEIIDVVMYNSVSPQDTQRFISMIEALDTPLIQPAVLQSNICGLTGKDYLEGNITLEDAVESIIAQVDLYLAEQQ